MNRLKILPLFCLLSIFCGSAAAELRDQGLNSIMEIIDKAIAELNQEMPEDGSEIDPAVLDNATTTIVNLSRTLGTLSFSRLQCGEAGVLAEFTQRVQQMPDESRDAMRDAFQEGFDKSKEETELLSQDECERLTASRARREAADDINVKAPEDSPRAEAEQAAPKVVEESPLEDPKLRYLRIADLSGQLAYRRKLCQGDRVFNRDYNEYLESVPEDYRDDVKAAYWQGYQRGKRLNRSFTREQCPQQG